MKSKIKVKNLNFWYGSRQILFDINLKIFKNQITALIGPSGCGKSTLLRCVNRMNDLIKNIMITGSIIYGGKNIYSKNVDVVGLRKKVGMVFQKPNPFPMSVFENVAYGLKLNGMKDKSEIKRIVQKSLEKADLWGEVKDYLKKSAFSLSGGQQQRLCIARALAINPNVILMDEPCSSLDPISTSKIEELLKKLKRETTIIIVTHNMQQARRVSDQTIYLLNGRVIEVGDTKQLFKKPENKLTRDYIRGKFG